MPLPVDVSATVEELAGQLVDQILSSLASAAGSGRRLLIGVPAGRTMVPVFDALEVALIARPVPLDLLTLVLMDDYVLPDGHGGWIAPPSSAHYSCRRFGEQIRVQLNGAVRGEPGIPESQLWSPDPADPSAYDRRIADAGGIDIFFVAVGASDGHVAFNPPGTPISSRTRIIPLASTTRTDNLRTFPQFASLDEVPTHGITVGLATMADTRRLEVVALGAGKAPAVARLLRSDGFDVDWPASFANLHANAALRIDEAAASHAR